MWPAASCKELIPRPTMGPNGRRSINNMVWRRSPGLIMSRRYVIFAFPLPAEHRTTDYRHQCLFCSQKVRASIDRTRIVGSFCSFSDSNMAKKKSSQHRPRSLPKLKGGPLSSTKEVPSLMLLLEKNRCRKPGIVLMNRSREEMP